MDTNNIVEIIFLVEFQTMLKILLRIFMAMQQMSLVMLKVILTLTKQKITYLKPQ
jgi:hypothetical protein